MNRIALTLALALLTTGAYAAEASCTVQATDKKLAGAAKNSFMKRCGTDAREACETAAKDKKLAGAAKTSFTRKCVADATGAADTADTAAAK